jgi:hypothetical protein
MPYDLDFYGVYFPRLLVLMLVALVISAVVRRGLAFIGVYSLVWHRSLFDFALYIVLLGALSSFTRW